MDVFENPKITEECLPMIVKTDIFYPKIIISPSSKFCKVLVPDIKKIFEIEGITGPDAYEISLMMTYKLWLPNKINNNTDQAEGVLSTSAASNTTSEIDSFEDWDVIFLDYLAKSPRQKYNWPTIRFNC